MRFLTYEPRKFFVLGARLFFGIWFLYVGLLKWFYIKPQIFIGAITNDFDKTWSPHGLNVALAWLILVAEPLLALLILSGKKARIVWMLTAAFLFMLTFGQTIMMSKDVVYNWQYLILALTCAALSDPERDAAPVGVTA